MKHLVIALLMCLSLPSWGLDSSNSTLQVASSIRGLNGLVGVNYEKMFTENHALQAGVGVDIIGSVVSLGYRYFDRAVTKQQTGTFLDKCFFLFECDVHPYVGASIQYAPPTRITAESENARSSYDTNDRYLAIANLGFRDVFTNKVILDVNIAYKTPLNKSLLTNTEGPDVESQKEMIHSFEKGLGLGISIGYIF